MTLERFLLINKILAIIFGLIGVVGFLLFNYFCYRAHRHLKEALRLMEERKKENKKRIEELERDKK